MDRSDIRKGLRVVFTGQLDGLAPLFEADGHKLVGKTGTIVYGISEDIFCYPDDPKSDMVWVAFEGDRNSAQTGFGCVAGAVAVKYRQSELSWD